MSVVVDMQAVLYCFHLFAFEKVLTKNHKAKSLVSLQFCLWPRCPTCCCICYVSLVIISHDAANDANMVVVVVV